MMLSVVGFLIGFLIGMLPWFERHVPMCRTCAGRGYGKYSDGSHYECGVCSGSGFNDNAAYWRFNP